VTTSAWRRLDPDRAESIEPARLEVHWAAQIAAAAGSSLLPARDDFEHTNLAWSPAQEALLGRTIAESDLRAGIRPRDLAIVLASENELFAEQTLAGRTLAQGLRWLSSEIEARWRGSMRALALPSHDLPPHPVGRGEAFAGVDGASLAVVGDWLANAQSAIEEVRARHAGSEARCWPHHFDVATRIALDVDRSIGAGVSLGDAREREPYFYVSPWPYPKGRELPLLPKGARWNTEVWVGALLPARALDPDPMAQRAQALAFFEAAIEICRSLSR
jgi:hypothetical protein